MKKLKYCLVAMRFRTLPQSLAGVVLGLMLATADYRVDWRAGLFLILTTVCLQILANICNELGDYLSGVDKAGERLGPKYTLSTGLLTKGDFKVMIAVFVVLTIVCGLLMIWFSFGSLLALESILLMILGAAAIMAAMRYTLGRNPYGYRGLGDVYVFVFFGIVAVSGAYFVCSHTMRWLMLLPSVSIGCLSIGVLNVNNIRDIETDRATRVTIPVRIGEKAAKWYHTALIATAWICMIAYALLRVFDPWHYLFVLTLPLFVMHLVKVWKNSGRALDPALPQLTISSLAFALLAGLGFLIYLF